MLFVGQAQFRGDLARYAKSFDMVELSAEPGRLPKAKKLAKWPDVVGSSFVFSLRLPPRWWQLDPTAALEWTQHAKLVAATLSARFVVVQTPATATPTARTRSRLEQLRVALGESDVRLAWEPRGVWEHQEGVDWASELGLLLVRDLSRDDAPPGAVVYTRLLALGEGRTVKTGAVARVSDQVVDRQEVYVVIEGGGARRAAQLLREDLSE